MSAKNLADFTPEMGEYTSLKPFRHWCQKVLPLVYDDSLSYYELLCKVVDYLNKTMEAVETLHFDVTNLNKAFIKLQNYVNNYFANLDVQDEINNKLDEMVKDGTLDTLLSGYLQVVNNISVNELILGTFLVSNNYLPSCCVMVNDYIYILSAPSVSYAKNNKTNVGKLDVFNFKTNMYLSSLSKEIVVGHANSVCFDGTNFYVAPVFDYSTGEELSANCIYKYDANFNNREVIASPGTNILGVSFDKHVYAFGYDHNIYTINDATLTKTWSVSVPDNAVYNQDFCMKNGVCYLSTPSGLVTKFIRLDGAYVPKVTNILNYVDAEFSKYMGESEGMEFNNSGHLLHTRYTLLGNYVLGFVCEIPANVPMYGIVSPSYTASNNTFTVSNEFRLTFKKYKANCMSISEIQASIEKPNRINITKDYKESGCVIRNGCIINTEGSAIFSFSSMLIYGCVLTFGKGNYKLLSETPITASRGAILNFAYTASFSTDMNSVSITIDDNTTPMFVSSNFINCANTVKIGDKVIKDDGLYSGSSFFGAIKEHNIVTNPVGINANSYHDFTVTYSKTFRSDPMLSVMLYSSSANAKCGSLSVTVVKANATGFTARVFNASDTLLIPALIYYAVDIL